MRKPRCKYPKNLITIDPGLNTGIAVWDGTQFPLTRDILLPNRMRGESVVDKVYYMSDQMQKFAGTLPSGRYNALIEGAGLWWGNTTSVISARMGNTFFLAYVIGAYITILGLEGIRSTIVSVPKWKGNKKKDDIANEVEVLNGMRYSSDHISDAVGIGFASVGLITRKHIK